MTIRMFLARRRLAKMVRANREQAAKFRERRSAAKLGWARRRGLIAH